MMSKTRKPDEFERGALIALSLVTRQHGVPEIAADAALDMGLGGLDVSDFTEYDLANFQLMTKARGNRFKLVGLRRGKRQ